MSITQLDVDYAKDWRLRAWLTHIQKAREGCRTHPNGLSRFTMEALDIDERKIRAEIARRKTLEKASQI